jgi:hypothetical protein
MSVGTPDWQNAVVSAQQLVETVPAATQIVTVGIPPNAESLIVMANQTTEPCTCEVVGMTTGAVYTGARTSAPYSAPAAKTYLFDVSSAADQNVRVQISPAANAPWTIYADAGTHVVADTSKLVNTRGQQYVIPTVPAVVAGDHPPNEVLEAQAFAAATGTVLVAQPGATSRLRIYSATIAYDNASGFASLAAIGSGGDIAYAIHGTTSTMVFPGQGFAYPANSGVFIFSSAGGTAFATICYTIETV